MAHWAGLAASYKRSGYDETSNVHPVLYSLKFAPVFWFEHNCFLRKQNLLFAIMTGPSMSGEACACYDVPRGVQE